MPYISHLDTSGKDNLADDPTTWSTIDFKPQKHKGKPTLNVLPTANAPTSLVPAGTATPTSAAEKQQKTDDERLQSWKRGKASAEDYPLLENDEHFTE